MKAIPLSICIIEADARLTGNLAKVIVDLGYQVSCMTDSFLKASQSIRKQKPAVIILGTPAEEQTMSHGDFMAELVQRGNPKLLYLMPWQALLPADFKEKRQILLPPYTLERVGEAVEKTLIGASDAEAASQSPAPALSWLRDRIFIRHKQVLARVFVKDICIVQADNAYIHITTPKQTYTVTAHLGRFEQMIRHPLLMRVHRSYIINLDLVESIEPNFSQVNLHNRGIPVSSSYREALKNRLSYL
ncbi:MAG: LytTR family transcriptional regulator DNA-binding domain-containing protein [Bacteroidota bacterium]